MELRQMIQDIAAAASRAGPVEEALQFALKRICQHQDWDVGHVYAIAEDGTGDAVPTDIWYSVPGKDFERLKQVTAQTRMTPNEGLIHRVLCSGQPQWIDDVRNDPNWVRGQAGNLGVAAAVAFPVFATTEATHVLEFYSDRPLSVEKEFRDVMESVGIQLGHVIRRNDLEKQVLAATEAEQWRIGQELHDTIGQQLSAISMMAASEAKALKAEKSPHAEKCAEIVKYLEDLNVRTGLLARGLVPVDVDAEGLTVALEGLTEQTRESHGIRCWFECERPIVLADNFVATQVYRIVQEAVRNAVRHADATQIVVRVIDSEHEFPVSPNDL